MCVLLDDFLQIWQIRWWAQTYICKFVCGLPDSRVTAMNVEVPRCALIVQGNGRLYCGIPEHICRESWGLCLFTFLCCWWLCFLSVCVEKTSDAMYKACGASYLSMHCSAIFPRCEMSEVYGFAFDLHTSRRHNAYVTGPVAGASVYNWVWWVLRCRMRFCCLRFVSYVFHLLEMFEDNELRLMYIFLESFLWGDTRGWKESLFVFLHLACAYAW